MLKQGQSIVSLLKATSTCDSPDSLSNLVISNTIVSALTLQTLYKEVRKLNENDAVPLVMSVLYNYQLEMRDLACSSPVQPIPEDEELAPYFDIINKENGLRSPEAMPKLHIQQPSLNDYFRCLNKWQGGFISKPTQISSCLAEELQQPKIVKILNDSYSNESAHAPLEELNRCALLFMAALGSQLESRFDAFIEKLNELGFFLIKDSSKGALWSGGIAVSMFARNYKDKFYPYESTLANGLQKHLFPILSRTDKDLLLSKFLLKFLDNLSTRVTVFLRTQDPTAYLHTIELRYLDAKDECSSILTEYVCVTNKWDTPTPLTWKHQLEAVQIPQGTSPHLFLKNKLCSQLRAAGEEVKTRLNKQRISAEEWVRIQEMKDWDEYICPRAAAEWERFDDQIQKPECQSMREMKCM